MTAERKDTWDKISIIGSGIVVPVLLIGGAFLSERYFSSVEQDINVISKFHEIYRDKETYRLARYFVPLVKDKETRFALSEYVIWNLLERNINQQNEFVFDGNDGDWHMLGEILKSLCRDDNHPDRYGSAFHYWQDLEKYTLEERWPEHAAELTKLYGMVNRGYISETEGCAQ